VWTGRKIQTFHRYVVPPFSDYKIRYNFAKLNGVTGQITVSIVTAIAVPHFAQSIVLVSNFYFPVATHRLLFPQCCLLPSFFEFDMENYKTD